MGVRVTMQSAGRYCELLGGEVLHFDPAGTKRIFDALVSTPTLGVPSGVAYAAAGLRVDFNSNAMLGNETVWNYYGQSGTV